ncbi:P-loop containing nucleoside triphosphate hydrolase protein [Cutaneotrichosporon oleaginosum]|uniref:p-loop containing nucleoside triphosphate hydrolase protein n=1 Tax=Cutaneotrichosporon oleaginosum TaxID=879819 RepID=A0A0J0XR23_9TREE|nr:P-loop containing nucleoside triphosphate hydrolase protein [Cutaneotrichosporon oleaginosum]KLT43566.1 P-loop containing nucleoside triphosphate hydrolase protein [Cutaneotrichosporon oleaginosum]
MEEKAQDTADMATMDEKDHTEVEASSKSDKAAAPLAPRWKRLRRNRGGPTPSPKGKAPPGPKPVKFRALFRFATPLETALMLIGLVLAAAAGSTTPLMSLMFGNMANALIQFGLARQAISHTSGAEEVAALAVAKANLITAAGNQALYLMGIGLGMFVCTYGYMLIWTYTSEAQSRRVRERYLQAVAYFDDFGAGALAARIQTDTHLVQVATGEKIAILAQTFSTFVTGHVVAYARNARIAGVLTVLLPLQVVVGATMGRLMPKAVMGALAFVAKAGSVAEEAISSIRTVHAFKTESIMARRFDGIAMQARKAGIKCAVIQGVGVGTSFFVSYIAYAIAFAYGGRLVSEGQTDAGTVLNCVMAILVGTFSISAAAPEMQHVFKGRAAAAKLWETIDRVPSIDSEDAGGAQPQLVAGRIEFDDVTFRYPSRPDTTVLDGLSTVFEAGQTTALVGPSGGGKSTVISLMERFYDPASGSVALDGAVLPSLNLRWLRGQIGLVSQEPVLFATSIRENVEMGLIGTPYEHSSAEEKDKMVREACHAANAEFVERLPKGYETEVGERGARLSGGQRQRIAIARAIVSNPRILLLDEATSALDAHAERIVQDALDRAAKGRTTVVVAHRLATVRNADKILVIADGRVAEQGTHDSLLALGGVYAGLVEHQKLEEAEVEEGGVSAKTTHEEDAALVMAEVESKKEEKAMRFGLRAMSARVFKINRDMWGWYALCFTGAVVNGMAFPVYAILLGLTIADFELPLSEIKGALETKAIFFFVVALVAGLSVACEILGSQRSGWELSRKLRSAAFSATLRRPIAWFDGENSGGLVARISDGPEKIQGLFGVTLGAALKAFVTIIGGCIVGLAYAPLLALVGIATVPLVFSAGYIRLRVVVLAAVRVQAVHQASAQMATEAVGALKTVVALRREVDVRTRYSAALEKAAARSTHTSLRSNALYAASQAMSFLSIALVFYVGARFVADGRYDTQRFFTGLTAVVLAAVNSGSVFGFVPDAGQASAAAKSVFGLIDGAPPPLPPTDEAVAPGHLRLDSVSFAYPTNPAPVLRGLSLDVPPGAFVALVGHSGCGKSTVLALLERFYAPDGGSITLGGRDIATLDLTAYRAIMAIVSQEPVLYSGTLRFNMSLGASDPDAVSDESVWAAAEGANIAEFIRSLPEGLDTDIGDHGAQLSGGQRQRVAIARALLRNPSILLLDEATAALDSASERAVQAALEAARRGRSVIAVAHRLSTIQHADLIYVMKAGTVVEKGTHAELMALKGEYYELVQVQNVSAQA